MRSVTFFGIITLFTAAAGLAACGDDTGTGSTSTGGGGTPSTTSATSSTGDTATATTGGSTTGASTGATGTGGGAPTLVNGCDPTALEDHTKDATVEIKFGNPDFKYSPPCIKIKSGTMVKFTGSFLSHPLSGGEIVNNAPMPDAKSPIKPTMDASPSATFAISPAGSYPYYCTDHFAGGMKGLIVAE